MTKAALNYVQIPAVDLEESITFYEEVLGWNVKRHPTPGAVVDQTAYPEFTDSSGHAGGAFVLGRRPSREPGVMACIAVDNINDILEAVVSHGGEVVKARTPIVEGADWEAIFRDPGRQHVPGYTSTGRYGRAAGFSHLNVVGNDVYSATSLAEWRVRVSQAQSSTGARIDTFPAISAGVH